MKKIIIAIAIAATTLAACNNAPNNKAENVSINDSSKVNNSISKNSGTNNNASPKIVGVMQQMITQYLQMKNALANDNGKDAAIAGNALVESIKKMDNSSLAAEKKKIWDNLSDDAKEMAQHIGMNGDKIEHQREHFEMLSTDMYDMVKALGSGEILYQDFCPMYNNKKGATWLSETKEINNPYLGKKMPACGSIKEEIK